MTNHQFPYGVFPLDDVFRTRYLADYSNADQYPLPDMLPSHHPLLLRLEGRAPLPDCPAPWWPDCVAQMAHPALRSLLATLSSEEFREGTIEASRWKRFRQGLSEEERDTVPSSPKLAALLEHSAYASWFAWRGPKDTPAPLDLLITTSPLYALYLSNGADWKSCQHFQSGAYNQCLAGNFYDLGVAMVMVLAPQTAIWEPGAVLARTTIRVFVDEGRPCIGVGQTYHNNDTLAFVLLSQLAALLDQHQLCWGWLCGVNTFSYARNGFLGAELKQRSQDAERLTLKSEPFWLPSGWSCPYVDGGEHSWEMPRPHVHQLQATLRLVKPLAATTCAA